MGLPDMPEAPKFTEAQRNYILNKLLEFQLSHTARSIKRDSEVLALRAAVIKLAELNPQVDRNSFAEWIGETEKHFHQELLKGLEDMDPSIAAVLDNRKLWDV